jgi:hypothetical protein
MVCWADDIRKLCGFKVDTERPTENIGRALKWLGFNTKRIGKSNTERGYSLDTPENRTIQEIVDFYVKRRDVAEAATVTYLPDRTPARRIA